MRLAIILCSLVFASAAFVVQPVQSQVLDDGAIEGRVCVSAPWGECTEPLPGATVHAVGAAVLGLAAVDKQATTDDEGMFRIEGLRDGDYEVTVSHTGFLTQEHSLAVSGQMYQEYVMEGELVEVAGRVVDASGKAIGGSYVSLWGGHGGWETATDADGAFSLHLPAGWYEVVVEAPDHRSLQQRLLIDGSDVELAFGALPGQEALLRGRVVDQHGDAVAGAAVVVSQWEARRSDGSVQYGHYRNSTLTGADGRYSIHAYGGDASIEVRKDGHGSAYDWFYLNATQAVTRDFELVKYPAKTAHVIGSVRNAEGEALPFATIRIELPAYGIDECSDRNRSAGGGSMEPSVAYDSAPGRYDDYGYRPAPCALQMDGGSFSGNVTPGYAILHVWYDRWAACGQSYHSDGSYERQCGPDYFAYTQTLQLQPDADNVIDVVMEQRPGPDAAISGYAVDVETGKAITGAWFSFQHQDAHAWGSASTDADGSYKVRLRSGYQHVQVWAEGYLPWQGTLKIAPGGEVPFDVGLTPGEARYGGCCYDHVYAAELSVSEDGEAASGPASSGPAPSPRPSSGGQGAEYEDMGGGLGPYDAAARAKLLEHDTQKAAKGIPNPLAFALAGIAVALLARRR